jgi:uncharacterized membrane protein YobD (UPF0266 family)
MSGQNIISVFLPNKNQQDALFYSQFISIINLYMFRAGLLLITRRYLSVYTAAGVFMRYVGWQLARSEWNSFGPALPAAS